MSRLIPVGGPTAQVYHARNHLQITFKCVVNFITRCNFIGFSTLFEIFSHLTALVFSQTTMLCAPCALSFSFFRATSTEIP